MENHRSEDLYLDLVVYPDGTVIVDDMDELKAAYDNHDIKEEQFNLAIKTSEELRCGLLHDIGQFIDFTKQCYKMVEYK